MQHKPLKILQLNIRSLVNKRDILEHYLEQNKIDIAILCETWLKNQSITFRNFQIKTRNRADGYGGVAIVVANNIRYSELNQKDYNVIESLELEIHSNNNIYKIISIYIRPQTPHRDLVTNFKKLLEENRHTENLIIAGDVNCHSTLWENNSTNDRKGRALAELISEEDLCVLNDGTHTYQQLANKYSSAIDITLTSNDLAQTAFWSVGENLTSDHLAIITEIGSKCVFKKSIKVHNKAKTIEQLQNENFNSIKNFSELHKTLTQTISNNSKSVVINEKFNPKLWWNENIKSLWEIKNHKQRLYNSHKTLYTAIELRKSNNRLKNVIREAKKATWENYLSSVAKGIPTKQI